MKIKTELDDIIQVPEELEREFGEWIKHMKNEDPDYINQVNLDNLKDASECFMEFYMDRWKSGGLNGEVVSPEWYDFEIAMELGRVPYDGGYPDSWTMRVPGYEVTCFGWMQDDADGVRMLAKAVDKND